jgi:polyisoprenoid-binding protein YceI
MRNQGKVHHFQRQHLDSLNSTERTSGNEGRKQMSRFQRIAFVLIGVGLSIGSSAAAPLAIGTYRITTAVVQVMCPLTVGGSFEARTSAVVGDLAIAEASGVVSGAVQVDLASLQTGIGLRDRHMKDKYLEIGRSSDTFTTAKLEEIRIERAEEGSMPFHGRLTLHGEQHPISGMADLQGQHGGRVCVRARFPISLAAFGIQSPRYLGVGVRDEVQVQVQFTAASTSSH